MSESNDFIIKDGELIRYIGDDSCVVIPEGVTVIKSSAFYDLDFMTAVTVPVSLKKVEKDAFERCYGVTKLTIKDLRRWCEVDIASSFLGWRTGCSIYCGDTPLERLEIPEGVRTIRKFVFCGGNNIRSVSIPKSVKHIGNKAFSDCENLLEVSGMEGVNTIGEFAFSSCGFRSFVMPQSIRNIGDGAFTHCKMLEEINFPDGIEKLGFWHVFDDCDRLRLIYADYGKLDIIRMHNEKLVWKAVRAFAYGYVNGEYSAEMSGKWLNYVLRHREEAFDELWDEPCFLKFMIDNKAMTAQRVDKLLARYLDAKTVIDEKRRFDGKALLMDQQNKTISQKRRNNRFSKDLDLDV